MTESLMIAERSLPVQALTRVLTVERPSSPPFNLQVLSPAKNAALVPVQPKRVPVVIKAVQLPAPAEFQVDVESAGPMELTLPFGMENCRINAATFKALAGRPKDNLLRKQGSAWQIVEDAELIDLKNKTVLYRLGRVQIYS